MIEFDMTPLIRSFDEYQRFFNMLESAKDEWRELTKKPQWWINPCAFDVWIENTYGLHQESTVQVVAYSEYRVVDPKKYSLFLLKFSNASVNPQYSDSQ